MIGRSPLRCGGDIALIVSRVHELVEALLPGLGSCVVRDQNGLLSEEPAHGCINGAVVCPEVLSCLLMSSTGGVEVMSTDT